MILQLGVALLGQAALGILMQGVQLFRPRAPVPRLTATEIGQLALSGARLGRRDETLGVADDPFTGGTLAFRESQAQVPGLVEQLALEAAIRREVARLPVPTRESSAPLLFFNPSAPGPPGPLPGDPMPRLPRIPISGPTAGEAIVARMAIPTSPAVPGFACNPSTLAGRRACTPAGRFI